MSIQFARTVIIIQENSEAGTTSSEFVCFFEKNIRVK